MSFAERQMSLRQKANSAMGSITGLRAAIEEQKAASAQLAAGVRKALVNLEQALHQTEEIVDALVQLVGPDDVQRVMAENRQARAQAEADQAKAAIEQALKNGDLAKAEKISEQTMVVGTEVDEKGKEVPPSYVAMVFSTILPEYRQTMLGQSAGFVLKMTNGHTFQVKELYDPVPKKKDETPAQDAQPAEQPAAAAEAPTPADPPAQA